MQPYFTAGNAVFERKNMNRIGCVFLVILSVLCLPASSFTQVQNPNSAVEIKADDILYHILVLASGQLQGRLAGTEGGRIAAAYIANEYERFGLVPAGDEGTYFQVFEFVSGVEAGNNNRLVVGSGDDRMPLAIHNDFIPLGFSSSGNVSGGVVFAGYGITAEDQNYDDYNGIEAENKVVVAFMYAPESEGPQGSFVTYEPARYKAMNARRHGAAALLLCYGYDSGEIDELPKMNYDQAAGDAGIPVVHIRRNVLEMLFAGSGTDARELEERINAGKKPASMALTGKTITLVTDIEFKKAKTQNVVGYLRGTASPTDDRVAVIGAHYDHLGLGEEHSMAPSLKGEVHNGADDNASGVAGLLELAEKFSHEGNRPKMTTVFVAFGAEEWGVLGSTYYVKHPVFPLEKTDFMMNFDMVGRLENNILTINGTGTSPAWHNVLNSINEDYGFTMKFSEGGLGGSDHTPFYTNSVPVLFFFTGTHEDYHKPSDDVEKIDSDAEEKIIRFAEAVLRNIDSRPEKIAYSRVSEPSGGRPARGFRVTLGVVPDFSAGDVKGMPISDVVDGGPASEAGLKGGDIIVSLGGKDITNIYDYMYILGELKPGQTVDVVVMRRDERITLTVTLRRRGR